MTDGLLRVVSRFVIPVIQVYGLYVILSGHIGGGFAGGMVLGIGFVLYALVFGLDEGQKRVPHDLVMVVGLVLFFTVFAELLIGQVFKVVIGVLVALVILAIFSAIVEEV